MLKICSIVFVVFLISLSATAQEDYAVTQRGDTLRGRVNFQQVGKIEQVSVKGETKHNLSSIQVRMASLKGKIYKPVQFSASVQMMEVMIDGYLSLMAFRPPNLMSYDGRLLLLRDGRALEVPSLGFKKYVSKFLSDDPELAEKIDHGDLDRKDLDKIVADFNSFVGKKTQILRERTEVVENQKSKLEMIDELRVEIEKSDIDAKKDLLDMLVEMKDKIANQKSVPAYLSNALKENLKAKPALLEKFEKLLSDL